VLYYGRRYDEAIEQCRKVVETEPGTASAHDCLGLCFLAKKMYESAIAECRKAADLSDDDRIGPWALRGPMLCRGGEPSRAAN